MKSSKIVCHFNSGESFQDRVNTFDKLFANTVHAPHEYTVSGHNWRKSTLTYKLGENPVLKIPVTILYKEMKTGGLRVKLNTVCHNYTLGEYKGQISFENVLNKTYSMASAEYSGNSMAKITRVVSKRSKNMSGFLDLSCYDELNKKIACVTRHLADRYCFEPKNLAYPSYANVSIPLSSNETQSIEMERIRDTHGHRNQNRITVIIKNSNYKRRNKHFGRVTETAKNIFDFENLCTLIDERISIRKVAIKEENIKRKEEELRKMVVGGMFLRHFPNIRAGGDVLRFNKGRYGTLTVDTIKDKEGKQKFSVDIYQSSETWNLDEKGLVKLVNCLDELGIMKHKPEEKNETDC